MRLDTALYQRGFSKSRSRARNDIESGCVFVNGKNIMKPAFNVEPEDEITMPDGGSLDYVSRGALKLAGALEKFQIDVSGCVFADIGASTGGFTDCLIRNGALKVYAVDCGTDQLDPMLKYSPKVVSIENFNARDISESVLGEKVDGAVMDLSFISQTLVIPALSKIIKENGMLISLVKPQFECGRSAISKGGIVKKKSDHLLALKKVKACARENDLFLSGAAVSPIRGGDGNREYLLYFIKSSGECCVGDFELEQAVNQ